MSEPTIDEVLRTDETINWIEPAVPMQFDGKRIKEAALVIVGDLVCEAVHLEDDTYCMTGTMFAPMIPTLKARRAWVKEWEEKLINIG